MLFNMADELRRTFWLMKGVFEVSLFAWPLSLTLTLNLISALVFSRSLNKFKRWGLLLAPSLLSILILLIGGVFWNSGPRSNTSEFVLTMNEILFGIQIILCAALIFWKKENRWVTISAMLITVFLGLASWFEAGMALTNTWL